MSFAGAEAKTARAFEHLKALDEDMARFFDSHAYPIGGQYNAEASQILLYATGLDNVPLLEWGVRIGECLHDLRSALDHVVWQLAVNDLGRLPTEKEARRIQFPIEDTEDGFKSAGVGKFLSAPHFAMLDQYQPYKAGDLAAHHKLAVLRRLSNTDKHRVVHAATAVPNEIDMEFTDTSGVVGYDELIIYVGKPLKADTPIGEINGVVVDRSDPHMEAQGPIKFGVVLDDPTDPVLHEKPLFPILGRVGEMADGIVGWIAHEVAPERAGS